MTQLKTLFLSTIISVFAFLLHTSSAFAQSAGSDTTKLERPKFSMTPT